MDNINDKSLANAIKKGELKISDLPSKKRKKITKIIRNTSDRELDIASKNKYKFSKRKIKHKSKKKNESMENNDDKLDFKKIITSLDEWEDKVEGGLAKDKKPEDFDLDDLAKGSEIQMEHTDDPEKAIDIAMDHLEEYDDYYDDEKGLPAMERQLEEDGLDDNEDDDDNYDEEDDYIEEDTDYEDDLAELSSDDEEFDEDEELNESSFIINFNEFMRMNENNEPSEPKMYPRENKFKRVIDFSPEVEASLKSHSFTEKEESDKDGGFVVYDIMDKDYYRTTEQPDDIRPSGVEEFDHMMNNL